MPVDANPATIVSGATPIAISWSYNGLATRTAVGNPQIDVDVPATGRFGGVYVQAINKPTRRIRTPPSCGWSISTRTRASSCG